MELRIYSLSLMPHYMCRVTNKISKTWDLEWITEHHVMKGSAEEFLECLHFPQIESNNFETCVHSIDEISDEQFHLLMDSDKVGDYLSYGSTFKPSVIFCVILQVLCQEHMIQEQFMVYCATLSMAYILAMSPITKMYSCISLLILPKKMKLRRRLSIDAHGKNILLKKLQRNLSILSETLC
jgi:hypothetical protein